MRFISTGSDGPGGQHRSVHRSRRRGLTATACGFSIVAAGLAGGLTGGIGAAAPAVAAPTDGTTSGTTTFNPLEDFSQWNVVSFGDTTIDAEAEGAVAVGGTLTFSGVNTAMHTAAQVDGDSIGLLASKVDFAGSSGQLKVQKGTFRVGSSETVSVLTKDQNGANVNAEAVVPNAAYNSEPNILAQNAAGASSGYEDGLFAKLFSKAAAQSASQRVLTAASCNLPAQVTTEGTRATVTLTAGGANFWTIDASVFSSLTEIRFQGVTPSADNPLVVNITGSSPVTFGNTLAGSRAPEGILWNIPEATEVAQKGGDIDGSVLAPNAHYEKTASNVQGNVVVGSADLKGSEEHYHPFAGLLKDCGSTDGGSFSVRKALSGVDASAFPPGTVFSVTGSWTQDGATETQVFELSPDGTVVAGPQDLPVGTVVSFSEATAPEVDGYAFTGVTFSPEKVTVAKGGNAVVTATNTYETKAAEVGGFSVKKVLVDAAGLVPAGTVFKVDYYLDGAETAAGTLEVKAGETVQGPQDLTVGTKVRFEEQTPASVDGGTWAAATISPSEITIGEEEGPVVTVTNTFTQSVVVTGHFSIEKKVEGADAGDKEFTFSYSTGSGEDQVATVKVGESWTSEALPEGTTVTVTETGTTDIGGFTFSGVQFSGEGVRVSEDGKSASLVVGDGTTVALAATNSYEKTPTPTPTTTPTGTQTPTPQPSTPGDRLAKTGFSGSTLAGGAVVLLLGGGLAGLAALRRRHS